MREENNKEKTLSKEVEMEKQELSFLFVFDRLRMHFVNRIRELHFEYNERMKDVKEKKKE